MYVEVKNLHDYQSCYGIQSSIITGISAIVMMNGYRADEYDYDWDECNEPIGYEGWMSHYLSWLYEYPEVITYTVTGIRRRRVKDIGSYSSFIVPCDELGSFQPGDWFAAYKGCCGDLLFGIYHDSRKDVSESFVPQLSIQNLCGWWGNYSDWTRGSIAQGPIPSIVQIVEPDFFEYEYYEDEIITYDLTKFYTFTFTKS